VEDLLAVAAEDPAVLVVSRWAEISTLTLRYHGHRYPLQSDAVHGCSIVGFLMSDSVVTRTRICVLGLVELDQAPTRVRYEEGKFIHTPDLRSGSARHPGGVVAGRTTGHTRAVTDSHTPGCRPSSAGAPHN
jgi:hypothetical protein